MSSGLQRSGTVDPDDVRQLRAWAEINGAVRRRLRDRPGLKMIEALKRVLDALEEE